MTANRLKVVNLFGGPGVGKSTLRAGLFWLLKSGGVSVEEVSEFAKYLVLTGRTWQLEAEQALVFAEQHHRQLILERAGYEWAVTDSPLLLPSIYGGPAEYAGFHEMARSGFDHFSNHNFFLTRAGMRTQFETRGRLQNAEAALEVEARMRRWLVEAGVPFTELEVSHRSPWEIAESLGLPAAAIPGIPASR